MGHLSGGHFICFLILASVNNAAMSMGVQILVLVPAFGSLGYEPRSGIGIWDSNSIFNCLRDYHTVFQIGCTIFSSHQQCTRAQISLHSHQHFFFSNNSHPNGCECNVTDFFKVYTLTFMVCLFKVVPYLFEFSHCLFEGGTITLPISFFVLGELGLFCRHMEKLWILKVRAVLLS